ncbi:hypothetical protein EI94DRAFT_1788387 [Lactarius quietus]|nr:hypothetical protein EI94DRAFT_1788387 [Lactarius quietus]
MSACTVMRGQLDQRWEGEKKWVSGGSVDKPAHNHISSYSEAKLETLFGNCDKTVYKTKKNIQFERDRHDSHTVSSALGSSSPFYVASDDSGHFERDDDLELTRWSRLQADHAHVCIRVVEVTVCETPATLGDRHTRCLSPGKTDSGRDCSFKDWCMAGVILVPLCQELSSNASVGIILGLTAVCCAGSLPRSKQNDGFGFLMIKGAYIEIPWILLFNGYQVGGPA